MLRQFGFGPSFTQSLVRINQRSKVYASLIRVFTDRSADPGARDRDVLVGSLRFKFGSEDLIRGRGETHVPNPGCQESCLFCNWTQHGTVCSRSSDPSYVVTYYIKWVTTSWTYSTCIRVYLINRCAR